MAGGQRGHLRLLVAAGAVTVLALLGITGALAVVGFTPETTLMLQLLRFMFPLHAAGVSGGGVHRHGERARPFLRPRARLGDVERGDDRQRIAAGPHLGATLEQQIFGLAIGVLVAGFVQMVFQLPSLHGEGYRFQWVSPWNDPTVREVVRKMIPGRSAWPRSRSTCSSPRATSSGDDTKTINATFDVAVRLMELPQGIFGISLATFLLPALSGLAAEKKYPEFRGMLNMGLNYITFTNLIAAAVSFARWPEPIVRLLFEHGKFDAEATRRVAVTLMCFAPGTVLFSINNILARAFFALNDTKTPMKVSVFCLLLNLGFAMVPVHRYNEAGLAIANTLSAVFNTDCCSRPAASSRGWILSACNETR